MNLNEIQVVHKINDENILKKYKTSNWVNITNNLYSLPINESIHYSALMCNDFDDYNLYIRDSEQPTHTFKKLIDEFDMQNLYLIENKITLDYNNRVVDGLHRLSIISYKYAMQLNNIIPDEWIIRKSFIWS